ncbi:MAG: gamma-glutamyltransferase family protein [Gudongella sp.]|nr:gamma-glutamyltransferase family protein [Gudongella sp.]
MGSKGMVATSQPLAVEAGIKILEKGGNAIDAAIASALALMVVEPTSTGIGGDSFALVWMGEKLYGLNSSGNSPKSISIEDLKSKGYTSIPQYGMIPVTVPGGIAGLVALSERFGILGFKELFKPAVKHAREGYIVTPIVSKLWEKAYNLYKDELKGAEFDEWFKTFAPRGRAPKAGELWKSDELADSLVLIAESKGEALYSGELADRIDTLSKKHGGYIRKSDLEKYKPEWVDPISVNYKGYDIWEIPPNGQGIVSLMALNILEGIDFNHLDEVEIFHYQIEAIKLAFADAEKYICDKNSMVYSVEELLSKDYAITRRRLIKVQAIEPICGNPKKNETIYIATADKDGNMVSLMQSHFIKFGSGVVIPGTGIPLHNRGTGFSFLSEHPNALEPNKSPYHTIIPGFVTKENRAIGPFGIVGGLMQPQGQVQLISDTIDFNMSPQAALDRYRWQWVGGKTIQVEPDFPDRIIKGLRAKGHVIEIQNDITTMGRGQIIWKDEDDTLYGGTDNRADGNVLEVRNGL